LISSNPIRILKKLDSHLRKSIELVVYGKSALYLLFPNDNQIEVTNDILSFGIEHKNWKTILESSRSQEFPKGVLPHRTRYIIDQGNYAPIGERYKIPMPQISVGARKVLSKN
jgi:hypothetical protein